MQSVFTPPTHIICSFVLFHLALAFKWNFFWIGLHIFLFAYLLFSLLRYPLQSSSLKPSLILFLPFFLSQLSVFASILIEFYCCVSEIPIKLIDIIDRLIIIFALIWGYKCHIRGCQVTFLGDCLIFVYVWFCTLGYSGYETAR